jgi:Tat protein secretion system quality control protein TatD with DNase activity
MDLYDAHNHLQDERFAGRQQEVLLTAKQTGVVRMVVNGSCEEDWTKTRWFFQALEFIPGIFSNVRKTGSPLWNNS